MDNSDDPSIATRFAASSRVRWNEFSSSRSGARFLWIVRKLFLVGVLAYLVHALRAVGWREIVDHLPTDPVFYALFLALYFLLPVAEVFMYRLTWTFDIVRAFPAFVKKRILNKEVIGYSGEVYFFSWARREIALPDVRLLETIRDNNILSSVASTTIVLVLLGIFLVVGEIRLSDLVGRGLGWYAFAACLLIGALVPIGLRYRRYLFSMPTKIAGILLAAQGARLLVGQVLQISQWAIVMPEVPVRIWFTFAALSIALTRIPLLPNQNLLFMGAGIELSHAVDISTAAVAGMLLVTNVLDKLLNLALFGLSTVLDRNPRPSASGPAPPREAIPPNAV